MIPNQHRTSSPFVRCLLSLSCWFALNTIAFSQPPNDSACLGRWDAELLLEEGSIRFGLEFRRPQADLDATLVNGDERILIPSVAPWQQGWRLDMPHYASTLDIQPTPEGRLTGTWTKRRSKNLPGIMSFRATRPVLATDTQPATRSSASRSPAEDRAHTEGARSWAGRWAMKFESSPDVAVGEFSMAEAWSPSPFRGTVLTTTGDYRYLAGQADEGGFELSCFDGSHAFRLAARWDPATQQLMGTFDSGNWHHETWAAHRDPSIELPDPLIGTSSREVDWDSLRFPDPDGTLRSFADPRWFSRPRIIEIFGTWCPNCHDAAPWLSELKRDYASKGLEVVGLACELTGDPSLDTLQVRRYLDRFHIDYPVLILGDADKDRASQALPMLDRLRAYPTFLFVDRHNRILATYTGFSGPATGPAYQRLQETFRRWTEKIVGLEE